MLDEFVENNDGDKKLMRATGSLEFKNVSFFYASGCDASSKNVLKNISFSIEPGQTIALVGRSGSGKSSLVSLLPRFHDLTEGQILIDGLDLYSIELDNLRQQYAIVAQQVTLFNDTVANNIAYGGMRGASLDKIISAATLANAIEFIDDLPEGLNTLIGENGARLSGGQKQRIALARAILKDAPILILDEATSALDTESERLIKEALDTFMQNRTTIVVAHRLSTIENADKILVLDQGRIVESGTHASLLAQKNYYAKLHYSHKDYMAVN